MSLTAQLAAFNRRALAPTQTQITMRDGTRYIEHNTTRTSGSVSDSDRGGGVCGSEGVYVVERLEGLNTAIVAMSESAGHSVVIPKRFKDNKWLPSVCGSDSVRGGSESVRGGESVCGGESDSVSGSDGEREGQRQLTFVSYNVWFSDKCQRERAVGLFRILSAADADFICLQEVTPVFLRWLLEEKWAQERYYISDSSTNTVTPYGVLLLSRHPLLKIELCTMPSNMGRRVLVAEADVPLHVAGQNIMQRMKIATVHLESMDNPDMRHEQLSVIFPLLQQAPVAFFMGDFNFGEGPENRVHLLTKDKESLEDGRLEYIDTWPHVHPELPAELGWSMPGEARIDRVLVRAPDVLVPHHIELLGTEPVPGIKYGPSDHYGLLASFKCT